MTLVVSVNNRDTIWILADRRLTKAGSLYRDDATKVMRFACLDGNGLIAYAGLGEVPGIKADGSPRELVDWVNAVLVGPPVSIAHALDTLASAARRDLPQDVKRLAGSRHTIVGHHFVIPAFVGDEVRQFGIDIAVDGVGSIKAFRSTRFAAPCSTPKAIRPPRCGLAGSGGGYLARRRGWIRPLLKLVRRHERGLIDAGVIADHLAYLNTQVAADIEDGSVGRGSWVAWTHRVGGGEHRVYDGTTPLRSTPPLPTNSWGMDVVELTNMIKPQLDNDMARMMTELRKSLGTKSD